MITVALESVVSSKAGRFDESTEGWEPIASAQASTEAEAKAAMLDNVLEGLNDESIETYSWLRLSYYEVNERYKVEVF